METKKNKKSKKAKKETGVSEKNLTSSESTPTAVEAASAKKTADKKEVKSRKNAEAAAEKVEKKSWTAIVGDKITDCKLWLKGVKTELDKITWPTKPQLISYTIVVIVTLLIVSLYLYILGNGFSWLFGKCGVV